MSGHGSAFVINITPTSIYAAVDYFCVSISIYFFYFSVYDVLAKLGSAVLAIFNIELRRYM